MRCRVYYFLVIVIGGIIGGVFTATEASAVAVLYTVLLSFYYKELSLKTSPSVILESSQTTAIVMLLIGASMCMSWVLSYENIPQDISNALLSISDNKIIILFMINLILSDGGSFYGRDSSSFDFHAHFFTHCYCFGDGSNALWYSSHAQSLYRTLYPTGGLCFIRWSWDCKNNYYKSH